MTEPESAIYLIGPELDLARRTNCREYICLLNLAKNLALCFLMFDVPLRRRKDLLDLYDEINSKVARAWMLKTAEELNGPAADLKNLIDIVQDAGADPNFIRALFASCNDHLELARRSVRDSERIPAPPSNECITQLNEYSKRRRESYEPIVLASNAALVRIKEITELRKSPPKLDLEKRPTDFDELSQRMESNRMMSEELMACGQTLRDFIARCYFGEDVLQEIIAEREKPRMSSLEMLLLRELIQYTALILREGNAPAPDRTRLYDIYRSVNASRKGANRFDGVPIPALAADVVKRVTELAQQSDAGDRYDELLTDYNDRLSQVSQDPWGRLRSARKAVSESSTAATLLARREEQEPVLSGEIASTAEGATAIGKEIKELNAAQKDQESNDYAALLVITKRLDRCKRKQEELLLAHNKLWECFYFGSDVVPMP